MPDRDPVLCYNASWLRAWWAKPALMLFLLLPAFSVAVWFGRDLLLQDLAELWIVSDTLSPADAVAVLGGGLKTRPFAAAEYYQKGLAKKVLVPSPPVDKSETIGGLPSHTELNCALLINLGVPKMAIETFGTGLSNTYEEAVALREWAARTHARSIIVPTEIFQSRRARWVLQHEFAGTGTQVKVLALDDPDYTTADWWKNEKGLLSFQNEVIKYVYYRFKY